MKNLRAKAYELFVQAYEKQLETALIPKGLDRVPPRMPEELLKAHFELLTEEYTKYMFKKMIRLLATEEEEIDESE